MKSKRLSNALIGVFLLFQLALPARGLVENKFESWGEFSWNMYSQTYDCWAKYLAYVQADAPVELDVRRYFAVPSRLSHVLNRANLPAFHSFLCQEVARGGRPARITASVSCLKNKLERRSLVRENEDICTAPDHAVLMD